MKQIFLCFLVVLMLTGCAAAGAGEPSATVSALLPETAPAETQPSQAVAEPVIPQGYGLSDLEGMWILSSFLVEGEFVDARSEGMGATFEVYRNSDHGLLAEYCVQYESQPERDGWFTDIPVIQTETESPDFSARLDSTTFAENPLYRGDYHLSFSEEGDLLLRHVWEADAGQGRSSVQYTFVRPGDIHRETEVLTAEFTDESWFSSVGFSDAVIGDLDPIENGAVPVMIQTSETLSDVQVVSLGYNEFSESLEQTGLLQDVGYLTPGTPLVLRLEFPGTIPSRGIQYRLGDTTKTFALLISGYDGSLLLSELENE